MTTTNTPLNLLPMPPKAGLISRVSHYVLAHERLILAIVAAVVLLLLVGKIDNVILHHDQQQLTIAQQQLAVTVAQNKIQDDKVKQSDLAVIQLSAAVAAQNVQIAAMNQQLSAALAKQKKIDSTLPPTQLASRIEQLAAVPAGSVKPTNPGYAVTDAGAVGIAQTLEENPVIKKQLANTELAKANDEKLIDTQKTDINDLHGQVTGLKTQIVEADKTCKEEIKVVKDKARKSKLKLVVAAYIGGLLTRGAIKILTGSGF